MAVTGPGTVQGLIARIRQGDRPAMSELFSIVYEQLKRAAHVQRRRHPEATLNTTALVHEAFLKLARGDGLDVRDRGHFMAVAATAMRCVLLDHARRRIAAKRGGGPAAVSIDVIEEALATGTELADTASEAMVALDESVARLARHSERQSRVVECRFFAGLSIEETALAVGTSPATVKRDWALAQAWLYRDLRDRLK